MGPRAGLDGGKSRLTGIRSPELPARSSVAIPTELCIYVFCVDLRTNSDYFPAQHYLPMQCQYSSAVPCTVLSGPVKISKTLPEEPPLALLRLSRASAG